jgi:hypothetical protein
MLGDEEINERFGFHKAAIEGPNATGPKHQHLRLAFVALAKELDELVPDGRAKSVAFTELETSAMWFHKAIARTAPLIPEIKPASFETPGKRFEKLKLDFLNGPGTVCDYDSDYEFAKDQRELGSLSKSDFEFLFGHVQRVDPGQMWEASRSPEWMDAAARLQMAENKYLLNHQFEDGLRTSAQKARHLCRLGRFSKEDFEIVFEKPPWKTYDELFPTPKI